MKYFLGLDIGSSSVGWAVTNDKFDLVRAKGQDLWGVSLFPEALVAETRRLKRGARRRWDRKKLMLQWLQEIFAKEISKIDENFFVRLKESPLHIDDKSECLQGAKESLFRFDANGENFTDKDYFAKNPTIFHLRKQLTQKPAEDIRFLYLALHNIVKNRGHFLNGDIEGDVISFKDAFERVGQILCDLEIECKLSQTNIDEKCENNLKLKIDPESENSRPFTFKRKVEFWCKSLKVSGDKTAEMIVKACVYGIINKSDVKKLFNIETAVEINLFDEEKMQSAITENGLGDLQVDLICEIRKIHSALVLNNLLNGNLYVCDAMVEIFEKHKNQLKMFKSFIKNYYPNQYFDMFRNKNFSKSKQSNYCLYANSLLLDGKKQVLGLKKDGETADYDRTLDGFYAYVKSVLQSAKPILENKDQEEYERQKQEILSLIDNKEFLLKQRTTNNSTIPNSFYIKELKQILAVNQEKYQFLKEKDETGLTNIDKIIQIAKFRIPYFVGPIGSRGKNSWVQRIDDAPLKAWNLKSIIDLDGAEEQFIKRMTNYCTYLPGKDALPKNSVIYSKYKALNELNNMTVNGRRLDVGVKQKLFNELYLKADPKAKITKNKIEKFLKANQIVSANDDLTIGGIADEVQGSMQSYLQIKKIIGEEFAQNQELLEDVVKWHTVLQEKENVRKRLRKKYPFLTTQMLKDLKGLTYKGWSTLSKEFLQDMKVVDKSTGEITNILNILFETQFNLQEILFNDRYTIRDENFDISESLTIKESLDKFKTGLGQITYEDVQELYCSPSVKRAIWQTIKIINELKTLLGDFPEKVFVEVTRGVDEGNDKNLRFKQLDQKYKEILKDKNLANDYAEIQRFVSELAGYKDDSLALRSDKLFLYFIQMGKCAYCGKPLSLVDAIVGNGCDIDHIIPQSMKKDDSLNNKVLACRHCNQEVKKDTYPICNLGFDKMEPVWKSWQKAGLISSEKFDRLTRKQELTAEDRAGFVNRQLVETSQSSKAVIELLIRLLGDERKIVFTKAGLVSDFRREFSRPYGYRKQFEGHSSLEKCRILNDLHHAKDAYLNIVVGHVTRQRFTDNPVTFFRNRESVEDKNTTNPIKIFHGRVYNYPKKEVVWDCEVDVPKVAKVCEKNSCLTNSVSYYKTNGQFYDETIYKSAKNQPETKAQFKLKGNASNPMSNTQKYGGYNSLKNGYYVLVEAKDKKGNLYRVIEAIPNIVLYQNRNSIGNDFIVEYLKTQGFIEPKIILDRINLRSTIKVDDAYFVVTGKTGNNFVLENANQFFTTAQNAHYIKVIDKFQTLKKSKKDNSLLKTKDKIVVSPASKDGNIEIALTREQNICLFDTIIEKLGDKVYALFKTVKQKMLIGREQFLVLSVEDQTQVLYNLINKLGTTGAPVDLSLIQPKGKIVADDDLLEDDDDAEEDGKEKGGFKNTGKIVIGKKITNKNIKLIIKSALGFKIKEVDLNKYGV